MMNLDKTFLDEFSHLDNNSIIEYAITYEFYESEWIKILLSRIHDDLFWIGEVPVRITTNLIHEMTRLPKTEAILPTSKDVRKLVEQACKSHSDKRGMKIEPIEEKDIKLMSMILGYRFQHENRVNSVSTTTISIAIILVKENGDFNLCETLHAQLMDNIRGYQT